MIKALEMIKKVYAKQLEQLLTFLKTFINCKNFN